MHHAELFGKPVLFTNWLIQRDTVPQGWHCYPLRPVADRGRGDGSSPPAAWVVVARFPHGKVFAYLPPGSLLDTPSCPLFSWERSILPLINRVSWKGKRNRLTEHFSDIFSCSPSPAGWRR
ncbi:LPD28 domain-containing protein [Intestinimonas butyriciproducens]|nr:LPD28 domain-containing protein [Intestinimonas butyriciproducens]MDB7816842.1 hypothetical protein [Intestinimonas butyriciproducens]MDB7842388.1 hypothetical protein [Intestinimonas butyriciproducens]MDB7857864.1 hypothetical protein [Intestinimonas butyriciproducens]